MWQILRRGFPDAHVRCQVPIRHCFADLASHKHKLVIAVDGGRHSEKVDAQRTRHVKAEGCRIIRFWNNDVLGNADGVAQVVDAAPASVSTPTPTLPHQGGGSNAEPPQWRD
jgi:very-short-patch-repair endonuclease